MADWRPPVTAVGDGTSLADRRRRAGQRIFLGVSGPTLDEVDRALIREIRPAGFILFKRNVVEPGQVRSLNEELASLVSTHQPALLSVDQEGGRVQRVRAPATEWPSARVVGRCPDQVEAFAVALAVELRAMGFNLNFAPVADVDSNPANPIIGDRSFGRRAAQVAERVVSFVRAHQGAGLIACVKHFPGHGDTSVDSHLELPVVEKELPELREVELRPFAEAVRAGVATVMTSHVVFPALDEDWPATLSSVIVPRLLRTELGFDGVVFSDDLDMKAISGRHGWSEVVRRATAATVDVLLCCNQQETQMAVFEALVRDQEATATAEKAAQRAEERVDALRRRFLRRELPPVALTEVGSRAHQDLAALLRALGAD